MHTRATTPDKKECHRMAMQTAQDLFMYELGDMYDAEQRIAQMLPQLANETDNPQVQQALQQHL
ncbi:MAG: DUF892 family protein, partial [Ktedonobacterales bacterium]